MNTMPSIVADYASDEMQRAILSIRQNPDVYVIADKANSEKKGATSASFPKMLAWTNKTTLLIETFLLDADSAGNDTKSAAKLSKNQLQNSSWEMTSS